MKVTSSGPNLSALPVESQIDAQLMVMERDQVKADGEASIKLIESAVQFENRPLTEGHVGRRINIAA